MSNNIRFSKQRTASGQMEVEDQDNLKCIYTQINRIQSIK